MEGTASGTGFFKAGEYAPSKYLLLFQGRGCDIVKCTRSMIPFHSSACRYRQQSADNKSPLTSVILPTHAVQTRHLRFLGRRTAGLFHHYRCSSSLFGKRPKLRAVLRSEGIEPSQAICIGDEIRDITAAHAENVPFGAVSWGYTKVESLAAHSPREIFTEVGQILERVG